MSAPDPIKRRHASESLHHVGVSLAHAHNELHRAIHVHGDGLTAAETSYLLKVLSGVVKVQSATRKVRSRTQHG